MTVKTQSLFLALAAAATVAAGLAIPTRAHAAFIVQPTAATATSQFGTRAPDQAIDGSGLSDVSIVNTGDDEPATYPSHTSSDQNDTMWLANDDAGQAIVFDLGQSFDITGFHVWNYNEKNGLTPRGANSVDVTFSSDNVTFGNATNFTFDEASGVDSYVGQDFTLGSTTIAQFVRFEILSNHGDTDFTGLSEVRFTAIPEPASLALIGLGGLVMALRRQRRA